MRMLARYEIPVVAGYGTVGHSLPHNTVHVDTVRITYEGKIATMADGRLVGQFLDPRASSYVYGSGSVTVCFKETPKADGKLVVDYEWEPHGLNGGEVQVRSADGELRWVSLDELRAALHQTPRQE